MTAGVGPGVRILDRRPRETIEFARAGSIGSEGAGRLDFEKMARTLRLTVAATRALGRDRVVPRFGAR